MALFLTARSHHALYLCMLQSQLPHHPRRRATRNRSDALPLGQRPCPQRGPEAFGFLITTSRTLCVNHGARSKTTSLQKRFQLYGMRVMLSTFEQCEIKRAKLVSE